jgi:transposase
VTTFLRQVLAIVPAPLLVIWDGGPIHRGPPVKALLAEVGPERLQVERLPGYAPDLNPDEGIWQHLKRVALRNTAFQTLAHLRTALREATIQLCSQPAVLHGCVREAGYEV